MEKKIKLGLIGLGQRGNGLLHTIFNIKDVAVVALCDQYIDRVQATAKRVVEHVQNEPKQTTDYREILQEDIDGIIVATSWSNHVEVTLAALKEGIPVGMEVGGTHSIEDCRKLVNCYEATRTPFMFLENCCYNKSELLVTSLVRNGVLGNISYCQGAYCHDLREEIAGGIDTHHYRLQEYQKFNCENYPTHELGPIAKILHINRGNRFKKLVSMSSKAQGMESYISQTPKYSNRLKGIKFNQGDVTTTMIQCENGETILLKLDTTLPRLYDRNLTVCGTKGFYCQTTEQVILDDGRYNHELPEENFRSFGNEKEFYQYLPKEWREITSEQIALGHGGMDYIMLKSFFSKIREQKPMPIDIYDAVSWMSVTALSEQSIAKGSIPIEFPDFTEGQYRERKTIDVLELPKI